MPPRQRLYQLASLFTAFQTAATPRLGAYSSSTLKYLPSSTRPMSLKVGQTEINRQFLSNIRSLWFNDYDEKALLPLQEHSKRWFMRTEEFDGRCRFHGLEVLDSAKTSPPSSSSLLETFHSPYDRLALILLFDQVSRNVYRGDTAGVVYTTFDRIAQGLATPLIDQVFSTPGPDPVENHEALHIRSNIGYRMWLYQPYMHSEELSHHDKISKGFDQMLEYVNILKSETPDELGRTFSAEELEATVARVEQSKDFEKQHRDIIERFGRYPYRNKVVGRESTHEEVAYVEGGGQTFGSVTVDI